MRTVLITGANKGIGFATAKYFMEHGDRVVITGRSKKAVRSRPSLGRRKELELSG